MYVFVYAYSVKICMKQIPLYIRKYVVHLQHSGVYQYKQRVIMPVFVIAQFILFGIMLNV